MHDDALKELWRAQRLETAPPPPDSKLLAEMNSRMSCLNRTLFWRDCRENIAAVVVILVFVAYLFFFPSPLARLGCVLEILSALFVIVYPIWRKRRVPKAPQGASMTESLESELRNVDLEIALLRSVHWWYIIPGTIGGLIFLAGLNHSIRSFGFLLLGGIAFDVFIYWINQIACDKKLVPLQRELQTLLRVDGIVPPPALPRKYFMVKIILLLCGLFLVGFSVHLIAKDVKESKVRPSLSISDPTSQMLEEIRIKHKFPALAAAVIADGKIVTTNAVGYRRQGGDEPVTVNDKFHLGSVTKSMTATVAAMLVEQGKISWTKTIGESFPEWANEIDTDYRGVTLEQLLSHRGGAPGNAPRDLWMKAWTATGTPAEQRLEFVKGLLTRSPEAKPGTKHIYSNQGYAIAGVMLEKATGKTWEELMQTMLFKPLEMNSAGFGAPASLGKIDQPWGHSKGIVTGIEPVPPGPRADNPPAIGPAGIVHCSLPDLAHYVAMHLTGERNGSDLLKPASFKKLHTSAGDDYALGWVVLDRKWASGRTLMHNGSNTMFYVVIWMAPEKNCAVIVATNVGVDGAFRGCDEAATKLIKQFVPDSGL